MSLEDIFLKASGDCKLLSEDIQAMIAGIKDKKKSSRKSLEPMTRLRKDTEELIRVDNTNPDEQFILDKLADIFKGK